MCSLQPAVRVAQKMGERLGKCQILLGPMPQGAVDKNADLVNYSNWM